MRACTCIFAEIVTTRIKHGIDPGETAFMFFCEQVQNLLGRDSAHTILIGDQDDEHMRSTVQRFASFRLAGTYWQFGIKIEHLVDTVHFARSHYSRLVQLGRLLSGSGVLVMSPGAPVIDSRPSADLQITSSVERLV